MSECVFVPNKSSCAEEGGSGSTPAPVCEPFNVCVGNHTLSYDGSCITLTPRANPIADGTYSQITFSGGCIVGVGHVPVPAYTPSACCAPAGSEGGSSGGGEVQVSGQPCNLLKKTAAGLEVMPTLRGSGSVDVRGCGTSNDPWVISLSGSSGGSGGSGSSTGAGSIVSGDTPIRVEASGATTIIGMNPSGVEAGTYEGLEVNQYGLVTGYTAPTTGGVRVLVGSPDVSAEQIARGAYKVDLVSTLPGAKTIAVGRYTIDVSAKGRVTRVVEAAGSSITGGRFFAPRHPNDPTIPAQVITFDSSGVITAVEPWIEPDLP